MLIVSNYHYIRNNFESNFPSIFGLTPIQFENQILELKKIGNFISPRDFYESSEEVLKSNQLFILISFDDGLKEQFSLAKPILDKNNINAIYFVNTENIFEKRVSLVHKIHLLRSIINPKEIIHALGITYKNLRLSQTEIEKACFHYNYDDDETAKLKYFLNFKLSFKQLDEFINELFENHFSEEEIVRDLYFNLKELKVLIAENSIGSHAHRHVPLGLHSKNSIRNEVIKSKKLLEEYSNKEIVSISYPYGNLESYKNPVKEICLDSGYKFGFTMNRGINRTGIDFMKLNRFDCNDLLLGKNEKLFIDEYSTIYK